jgi:hypothetical protein
MSPAKLTRLAASPGIEAVAVEVDGAREHRGNEKWFALLDEAVRLRSLVSENLRIAIGGYVIHVVSKRKQIVAVVLASGHPTTKSLQRMIDRATKSDASAVEAGTAAS